MSRRLPPGSVEQELEAEPRRRVRPGAERAAGVDHDRDRAGVGLLPRRADPERADAHRPVECAPAVLPALLDVGRARAAEGRPEPLLAARVGVGDQLDAAGGLPLLEALGEELEHQRAAVLGLRGADGHGDPAQAQRNALFSLSKNPSSLL